MNINTYTPNGFSSWTEYYRKTNKTFWVKNCFYLGMIVMCFVATGFLEVV